MVRFGEILSLAFFPQMGTNKCASQAGMTAYGTRRHLYDPKTQTDKPYDQTTISLQMGTNKGASQVKTHSPYNAALIRSFYFLQSSRGDQNQQFNT